ncbi:hypothetical protein, partial [Crocosphaera sp. Alani8]|uniref:hypothetical protein n=1 Tax=Crocosphaera sp. Alani8 TaxID=3038952 RepID=UPI00313C6A6F
MPNKNTSVGLEGDLKIRPFSIESPKGNTSVGLEGDLKIRPFSSELPNGTSKCNHEYEKVTLNKETILCVKVPLHDDLPNKDDSNYWRKRGKLIEKDAKTFSTELNIFARMGLEIDELKLGGMLEKKANDYCVFPITYKLKNIYFDEPYDVEVMRIGVPCDENGKNKVEKEWPADKSKIEGSIKEKIEDSINKYRDNYTLNQEYKGNEPRQEDEQEQIYNDKLSNNDELNNQAVLVEDTPLFYIRAWNNGYSPKERAEKATKKIQQILEGKIDIEGLGIFEESDDNVNSQNRSDGNQKTKIIKIISDSKFLNEEEKNIIEVNQNDAIFEREQDTSTLARKYLSKIIRGIKAHKSLQQEGYPVKFSAFYPFNLLDLDWFTYEDESIPNFLYADWLKNIVDWFKDANKPLFSVKTAVGYTLDNPSFRASQISKKIKDFAQDTFWFKDIVVASYIVNEIDNTEKNEASQKVWGDSPKVRGQ